ncbi:MAG: hypothetical protein M1823_000680 [Watsoniomyces obsoletus]|nr:MAG: hypothetical protein M1823_000680 [Watsoniomyces obsoletus]
MPFRDRVRKAFGRTPSTPQEQQQSGGRQRQSAPPPKKAQQQSQQQPQPTPRNPHELVPKRTKSQKANVYRIGDHMPPPKYPGKYDKPHQDMLRAFSFQTAFGRRRSSTTDISPMGSRWASRKNSEVGGRRSTSHRPSHMLESMDVDENDDMNGLARSSTVEPTQRSLGYDLASEHHIGRLRDRPRTSDSTTYFTADESLADS